MATAAMTSTSSSSISSTNNTHSSSSGAGSSASTSKLFPGASSGYGSLPSSSSSLSSSSIRSRRGRQSSSIISCSGPSRFVLPSASSSSVIRSSNTVSRFSGSRKDNIPGISLDKLRGLKWKAFYDKTGILSEINSSDNEDFIGQGRSNVKRLDKSDMGLYGLCPETEPFYAVICDICNAVVKPQGLQRHIFNRHNTNSSHHGSLHYHSSSQHTSANRNLSRLEHSNEHYLQSHSTVSSSSVSSTSSPSSTSSSSSSSSSSSLIQRHQNSSSNSSSGSVADGISSKTNYMGLYDGLCQDADSFYGVICEICNGVFKPQALQKHMFNRHNTNSSHHGSNHYHSTSTSRNLSASGHSERSTQHYSPSHSAVSSTVTTKNPHAGISAGAPSSSNATPSSSNFQSSGSSSSRSKSKSTSKVKSKSGKSSSNHISSSNVSSTSSSSIQRHHNSSNATAANSSTTNGSSSATASGSSSKSNYTSTSQSTAITAANTSSHSITSSTRAIHPSAQKTDSNLKQIKPPLTGTACLSALSNVTQHLQPQGGIPSKGMVAPTTHSEASTTIPDCLMPSIVVSSSNSNSSISSSSSSTSISLSRSLSNSVRRTYGRSKGSSLERKNLPVKDREYDADRHCGVLTGEPPRPCTRSLTCKSHALSMRRMVSGRTKSFDKLLSDHRTTKDSSRSSKNSHSSVSRIIPEFESSNSSSSIEMDRRSSQSVSSNSNLSTEAQPHSSSSSMSPTPLMSSNTPPIIASVAASTSAAVATRVAASSPPRSSTTNIIVQGNRRITLPAIIQCRNPRNAHIREASQIIQSESGQIQLNISDVAASSRSVHTSIPVAEGDTAAIPQKIKVITRRIESARSEIPEDLLDDSKYEKSVFSADSTILKRPITLLADEDEEEFKRARTIDNDIDMMNISKDRKLQLKIQYRVQMKNKYRFRAPGEPSEYALSMPPAAAAVAKLFLENNPTATVTNARFVLDPESNTVCVNMNGTFDPNDMKVNWRKLDKKFVEEIILDSLRPHGVTVGENGQLNIPERKFEIPNPEDEGFLIHHHKPMTEEEYANLRPEFINGMPKPISVIIPGIKTDVKPEIKNESNPIDTSHLPPILPNLHKELMNIQKEIKQEIKEEPMNEDEILEYCQPAEYFEGNETYNDIPPEVSSIDPSSFDVPTSDHDPSLESYQNDIDSNDMMPEQQMTQAEISQCLDSNMLPSQTDYQLNDSLAMNVVNQLDMAPLLGQHPTETGMTNDLINDGDVPPMPSEMEFSNFTVTSNEISFNIPLGDITPQEISNAISAITGVDVEESEDAPQNIDEILQQQPEVEEIQQEVQQQLEQVRQNDVQEQQQLPQIHEVPIIAHPPFEFASPVVEVVEPMSIMPEVDDESFDDSDLGLVDAISSNTKITHGDIVFASHQEKENAKILIENNFYDTSPYSRDVMRGVKTWHNSAPKPLSVNMFGLVKLRGGTIFKKNVVSTRKTNVSIQSYQYMKTNNAILFRRDRAPEYFRIDSNSVVVNGNIDQLTNLIKQPNVINRNLIKGGRPQRRIVPLGTANTVRRQPAAAIQQALNPFFKPYNSMNGTRPKLQKRSIILHKGQMNKTCRALRSNIVGKLSEHLLGYKKFNNSAKNSSSNTGTNSSSQQTHGSSSAGSSGRSSKSSVNVNGSISRSSHLDSSSKGKSSSRISSSSGNGGSSNRSTSTSNSVFLAVQPSFNSNSNSSTASGSVRYANTNGAAHRLSSSKATAGSSSSSSGGSSSFVSSRSSSLANHHRNGTDFN